MPLSGLIPEWVLTLLAAATLFTVMFDIGLSVTVGEFRWVARQWPVLARALVAVLVVTPVLGLAIARLLAVPFPVEIGIILMVISPGAPVTLRRSLDAGGHHAFAPALQISLALLAVVSMPAWVALLDVVYAGHAVIGPRDIARQVLTTQLLPLCAGMLARLALPRVATTLIPRLDRISKVLLIAFAVLVVIDVWPAADIAPRNALAVFLVTACALAAGHALGGPLPATRTATALSCAMRNAGLAFLVATINHAGAEIVAAVLGYLLVSLVAVTMYVVWRRRSGPRVQAA